MDTEPLPSRTCYTLYHPVRLISSNKERDVVPTDTQPLRLEFLVCGRVLVSRTGEAGRAGACSVLSDAPVSPQKLWQALQLARDSYPAAADRHLVIDLRLPRDDEGIRRRLADAAARHRQVAARPALVAA